MNALLRARRAHAQPAAVPRAAATHGLAARRQRGLGNDAVGRLFQANAGQALPDRVRAEMEARFGQDFSAVRVHTGADAALAAEEQGAAAFTLGRDVVFGGGRYAPDSGGGRALLAHELAHVVQQGRGGLPPSSETGDGLEAEASRAAAARAGSDGPVAVGGASGVGLARQELFPGQRKLYPRTVTFNDLADYEAATLSRNLGPPTQSAEGPTTVTAIEWLPYAESSVAPPEPVSGPVSGPKSRPKPAPEKPIDVHLLTDLAEAMQPRLIYPKPVRQFFGGLQALGGGLEAGIGGVGGIATAETGVGLAAGGFLLLHGADVASSGWHTLWTGEESRTYTFRLGAGLAEAGGADPKLQAAIGQSTDLIANIGSAGLSLRVLPSPAIALTPEAEFELQLARMARYEGQPLRLEPPAGSVGAAALDDPAFSAAPALRAEDVQAWLKSIRRYNERLVFGRTTSTDPEVLARLADVDAALASGDRTRIGSAMHALHFEFAQELEGPEFLVNRRLATPGQLSDYRLPDFRLQDPSYIPGRTVQVWDYKPLSLNEYSFYLTEQFSDIRTATQVDPVPLYYRVPRPRGNIPRALRGFQRAP